MSHTGTNARSFLLNALLAHLLWPLAVAVGWVVYVTVFVTATTLNPFLGVLTAGTAVVAALTLMWVVYPFLLVIAVPVNALIAGVVWLFARDRRAVGIFISVTAWLTVVAIYLSRTPPVTPTELSEGMTPLDPFSYLSMAAWGGVAFGLILFRHRSPARHVGATPKLLIKCPPVLS